MSRLRPKVDRCGARPPGREGDTRLYLVGHFCTRRKGHTQNPKTAEHRSGNDAWHDGDARARPYHPTRRGHNPKASWTRCMRSWEDKGACYVVGSPLGAVAQPHTCRSKKGHPPPCICSTCRKPEPRSKGRAKEVA